MKREREYFCPECDRKLYKIREFKPDFSDTNSQIILWELICRGSKERCSFPFVSLSSTSPLSEKTETAP
jgi:hypothetical protein